MKSDMHSTRPCSTTSNVSSISSHSMLLVTSSTTSLVSAVASEPGATKWLRSNHSSPRPPVSTMRLKWLRSTTGQRKKLNFWQMLDWSLHRLHLLCHLLRCAFSNIYLTLFLFFRVIFSKPDVLFFSIFYSLLSSKK